MGPYLLTGDGAHLSKIPPTYPWKIPRMVHQQFMKDFLSLWGFGEVWGFGVSSQGPWNHPWLYRNFSCSDTMGFFDFAESLSCRFDFIVSEARVWGEGMVPTSQPTPPSKGSLKPSCYWTCVFWERVMLGGLIDKGLWDEGIWLEGIFHLFIYLFIYCFIYWCRYVYWIKGHFSCIFVLGSGNL